MSTTRFKEIEDKTSTRASLCVAPKIDTVLRNRTTRNRALLYFAFPSIRTWCWCLRWGIWVSGRSDQSFCVNTEHLFSRPSPIFPARYRMVPNHPCLFIYRVLLAGHSPPIPSCLPCVPPCPPCPATRRPHRNAEPSKTNRALSHRRHHLRDAPRLRATPPSRTGQHGAQPRMRTRAHEGGGVCHCG